jgi:hypothetical protein
LIKGSKGPEPEAGTTPFRPGASADMPLTAY